MSRGSNEGEFGLNEGIKLPIIQEASIIASPSLKADPEKFIQDELEILRKENSYLATWLDDAVRFQEENPRKISHYLRMTVALYRILRSQAEIDAIRPKEDDIPNFMVVGQPLLPEVLPGADAALPFETMMSSRFARQVLALMKQDKQEYLRGVLLRNYPGPELLRACGMYWLLRFHSKPREKKKD